MELFGGLERMSDMGEIRVKVKLENVEDRALYEAGHIAEARIRALTIDAVVDTGAVMVLLPQELTEALGLKKFARRVVVLADDQKIELDQAGTLSLTIGDREMKTDCLVGPPGCEALVGQIVMEALDLIADPAKRTLTPRPESPFLPTLKMK
jgi:clan AA aspartic protease